ncbi:MAG TPA: tRNA lysidine(34) synthetase TilS [Steroidobacteraceae bacterium]|nr:tRNA lysidine(34) synthetase TilS [Steroidobacteraceae bacterium]
MSKFSVAAFQSALQAHLPRAFNGRLCVAFSGGVDSSVLLLALNECRAEHRDWHVRAIHIDHQLHASSGDWASHCKRFADQLGVASAIERVHVARDDAQGLEAAARTARYEVFRRELQHGEVLLTAHHADDQAETVMLALMRGSGVQGLAAMPALKAFGRGWHCRPMLSFTRADLEIWAREQSIDAINDPANALLRHDRNYLRHEVLPALQKRWPQMAGGIVRSANHLGEALGLLEELAASDLRHCAVERCLDIGALRNLTSARRRNLLRYWLRLRGLPLPSTRKLSGLEHDLLNTDSDRMPCVTWPGAELHWHRGLLYASTPSLPLDRTYACEWNRQQTLQLPGVLGNLSMQSTLSSGLSAARLPERLTIRFRQGGEKIRLPGRGHRHALGKLLQEHDVLPWERERVPLIYIDKQLIAVGDFVWSSDFASAKGEAALQVRWGGAPEWKAVRRE